VNFVIAKIEFANRMSGARKSYRSEFLAIPKKRGSSLAESHSGRVTLPEVMMAVTTRQADAGLKMGVAQAMRDIMLFSNQGKAPPWYSTQTAGYWNLLRHLS
jgi:hypothetical protein